MDGQRFDHLARVLARGAGRRRMLGGLAAAALGAALALIGAGDGGEETAAAGCYKKKKRCRDHHQCCSGRCRKGWCKGGKRKPRTCRPGTTRCLDRCVDLWKDAANCGACGTRCGADQICAGGACTCDGNSCPCEGGLHRCGNACVDRQVDPEHCGACGVTCDEDEVCESGTCTCPTGQRNCNGRCLPEDDCCGFCIKLAWSETPRDLDSHAWAPDGTEVSFPAKGTVTAFPFIELDVDDTTSFGPEQISISQLLPGRTDYAVHNWSAGCSSEISSLARSGATVQVTRDGVELQTFVAPETGEGLWWNVFHLNGDGDLTAVNEISDTPPQPSHATTCSFGATLWPGAAGKKGPGKQGAEPGRATAKRVTKEPSRKRNRRRGRPGQHRARPGQGGG